jgi:hypothetical protein
VRDYYVSATVCARHVKDASYCLWAARIQAHCLSDARAHAYLLIDHANLDLGELHVMWDEAPAIIAPTFTDSNLQETTNARS